MYHISVGFELAAVHGIVGEVMQLVIKGKRVTDIIWKVHGDVLMASVECVVALEIQKSSWTAHRWYWGNEGVAFAGVVERTCCVGVNSHPDLLAHYGCPWVLRIGIRLQFIRTPHKLVLSCWTCIMAPKTFEVDSADVTASSLCPEKSINLFEVFHCEIIIDGVATAQPARLDVIFAGLKGS